MRYHLSLRALASRRDVIDPRRLRDAQVIAGVAEPVIGEDVRAQFAVEPVVLQVRKHPEPVGGVEVGPQLAEGGGDGGAGGEGHEDTVRTSCAVVDVKSTRDTGRSTSQPFTRGRDVL